MVSSGAGDAGASATVLTVAATGASWTEQSLSIHYLGGIQPGKTFSFNLNQVEGL
jgi:hypothetical protein